MTDPDDAIEPGAWERARMSWPGIEIPKDVFSEFVRSSSTAAPPGQASRARDDVLRDLYLTCACSMGNPLAIMRFEEQYEPLFDRIRRRFGALGPDPDELQAEVRAHLFAPRPDGPPRIVEYAGWVDLGGWLKVVVTRLVLNRIAAAKPEDAYEDRIFETLLVTEETPEGMFMKREAQAAFRSALRHAVRELGGRDRQLLRLAFAERLSIDEVAALYDVHRTTAFRWIKHASEQLAATLERLVRAELGLSAESYAHWCAALRSRLELSIERYLTSTE